MYRLLRALLFLFPAERAHHLGMGALTLLEGALIVARWLRRGVPGDPVLRTTLAGLPLPNPVGLAAGLDKDGEAIVGLFALGFGFVEVGTVTPRPQSGNPAPRLFRLVSHRALLNRMGFNNHGVDALAGRLRELAWRPGPIGVNVGKNATTPLAAAADDYLACLERVAEHADYLVLNASSPNTPGLRQLQEPVALRELLTRARAVLARVAPAKPLLLKISPDLSDPALDELVDVALACGVDGLIATNTTLERPVGHRLAAEPGGLSGEPLRDRATAVIRRVWLRSHGRLAIVGVGGIASGRDAYEKIRAGACAVQLYTALIYEGPALVRRVLRELRELLRRDGFRSVEEAVGFDAKASASTAAAASAEARATGESGLGGVEFQKR